MMRSSFLKQHDLKYEEVSHVEDFTLWGKLLAIDGALMVS